MDGQPRGRGEASWIDVAIASLALAVFLVLGVLLREAGQTPLSAVVLAGAILLPIPACVGGLWRDDPPLFGTIVLPTLVAAVLSVVLAFAGAFPWSSLVLILGGAWLYAWVFAGTTMGRWRRRLLRLPPDPDIAFSDAWRAYRRRLVAGADSDELWVMLQAMSEQATERMEPLVNTWFCQLSLGPRADDEARGRRLFDRQVELVRWYNDKRAVARGPLPNPARPTEGSHLELLFPELEALLAVATVEERVAMAESAARFVCGLAGLDMRTVEAALEEEAWDPATTDVAAALGGSAGPDQRDDPTLRYRRALAIASVDGARGASERVADASLAIYYAACHCDDQELAELDSQLRELVALERLASATEVTVDTARVTEARRPQDRLIPLSMPIAIVAWVGFLAGAGGIVVRAAAWTVLLDRAPRGEAIAPVVGLAVTCLLTWLLLRGFRHRLRPGNAIDLVLAGVVATTIGEAFRNPSSTLVRTLAPGIWESVFAHRTNVMPYAPLYGAAMLVVLVGIAVYTRRMSR